MCTAISFLSGDHYFGRNLDLEYCYKETVTITPRHFPFHFRKAGMIPQHFGMIGIATICENYPLYYEATNEMGLSMAGLNFPGNAFYAQPWEGEDNISPFELIPWILCQCASVKEARQLLEHTNIVSIPFSSEFPLSPLHWMISDKEESITVEPLKSGIAIWDNPIGVLTNNPPFDFHLQNLSCYLTLSPKEPINALAPSLSLSPFSRGMGAMGLPGDLSSPSRFIRCVFTKYHSITPHEETAAVSQFFHILRSVAMTEGTVQLLSGLEKTVYTCCCNTTKGIYYYTSYENSQITAVRMHNENLDSDSLIAYPLHRKENIFFEN